MIRRFLVAFVLALPLLALATAAIADCGGAHGASDQIAQPAPSPPPKPGT